MNTPKNTTYGIIGAAGYVAPKHMRAIADIGGGLVVAVDPNDNLEVLDQYFPDCDYFPDTASLEKFLTDHPVDYLTICSPTYLHAKHIEFTLKNGLHAICEGPLVLSEAELDTLQQLEQETGKKIYTILQYHYHPELIRLKEEFDPGKTYEIDLVHHAFRGKWFSKSWKGDPAKSGGIRMTRGYHFFDALAWIYGTPIRIEQEHETDEEYKGKLILQHAVVHFSLSNASVNNKAGKQRTLFIGGKTIDLNIPVEDGYRTSYQEITAGKGFGTEDIRPVMHLLAK